MIEMRMKLRKNVEAWGRVEASMSMILLGLSFICCTASKVPFTSVATRSTCTT